MVYELWPTMKVKFIHCFMTVEMWALWGRVGLPVMAAEMTGETNKNKSGTDLNIPDIFVFLCLLSLSSTSWLCDSFEADSS